MLIHTILYNVCKNAHKLQNNQSKALLNYKHNQQPLFSDTNFVNKRFATHWYMHDQRIWI